MASGAYCSLTVKIILRPKSARDKKARDCAEKFLEVADRFDGLYVYILLTVKSRALGVTLERPVIIFCKQDRYIRS